MKDLKTLSVDKKINTLSPKNRELVLKFQNECYAQGLSKRRVCKYRGCILKIAKILNRDLDDVTTADIKTLVATIEMSDYMEWTKHDYKIAIKRFYKWLRNVEDGYPDEVKWIKTTLKKNRNRLPDEMLTQQEIKQMIHKATHIRDKALISTLYESGCRIGELLDMKIKNVEFDEYGAVIRLHGKTGSRRVRLVDSLPYLSNWIEHHPNREARESHLWVSIGTLNHGKQICYNSVRKMLRIVAERAGIKKKVNPHIFRHSRATYLANMLKEAQMNQYFGWIQGSDMPATYVHLSGRDVDNAILEMHGIVDRSKNNREKDLEPKECPRCETKNECTAKFCRRCGLPLDPKTALEVQNKEKRLVSMMTPDMIDQMIRKRVAEIIQETIQQRQVRVSDSFASRPEEQP